MIYSISQSDCYDELTLPADRVTTEEARNRLEDTVFSALRAGENTLIDAPTALGKSHTVATTRWRDYPEVTGGQPVVHFHATTDAREDAIEKSRNDFGGESVGALFGCIDPGDDPVLDWLAFFDPDARPEMITTAAGERKRKPGRGFVGPDADAAHEFLRSIRENHVAQDVGRYARNPDDPDSEAIVYVWSDVLPESLTDTTLDTSFSWVTDKKEEILEMVQMQGTVTAREVVDKLDGDKSYAIDCLD